MRAAPPRERTDGRNCNSSFRIALATLATLANPFATEAFLIPPSRSNGRQFVAGRGGVRSVGPKMDDELRRIRRERWLASVGGGSRGGDSGGGGGSNPVAAGEGREGRAERMSRKKSGGAGGRTAPSEGEVVDLTADSDGDSGSDGSIVGGVSGPSKKKARPKSKSKRREGAPSPGGAVASRKPRARAGKNVVSHGGGGAAAAAASTTSTSSSSSSRFSFSVASYNVWFGPPHPSARMERIASILSTSAPSKPIFVGLQEVTPPLSRSLFPLLRSEGYETVSQDIPENSYGCSVAVLTCAVGGAEIIASGFLPYSRTIMGRGLVWVHAKLGGTGNDSREVLFGTTHLESFMRNYPRPGQTYDGAKERESQILEAKDFVQSFMSKRAGIKAAFITGDLNWDAERKRSAGIDRPLLSVLDGDGRDSEWIDAMPSAKPGHLCGLTSDFGFWVTWVVSACVPRAPRVAS